MRLTLGTTEVPVINLSLEERERLAYISGNTQEAALYAEMLEMKDDIYGLENEVEDLRVYGGCENCDGY
jgi:hypothetical protein